MISRGPKTFSCSKSSRNCRCDGRPNMPRIVVTPFAANSVITLPSSCDETSGTCACISASPGMRYRSVPSTISMSLGNGVLSTGPMTLIRPFSTSTVCAGSTRSLVIDTTLTLIMAVVWPRQDLRESVRVAHKPQTAILIRALVLLIHSRFYFEDYHPIEFNIQN